MSNQIIKRIQQRFNRNKNWIAAICGGTGSGKSYTAMELCRLIYPGFDITKHMAFTPSQFMNIVTGDNLEQGAAIIWDEAGVGIPAREWYSVSNKSLNYVFQTFRDLNLAVILTTPTLAYIDVSLRRLFHAYLQAMGIDYQRNMTRVKYYEVQNNPKSGVIYYKRPRIMMPDGSIVTVDMMHFKKPPVKMWHQYEKLRKKYSIKLRSTSQTNITDIGKPKEGQPGKYQKILQEFESGNTNIIEIASRVGCSPSYVREIRGHLKTQKR